MANASEWLLSDREFNGEYFLWTIRDYMCVANC